ncbi:MAG: hypothetical protein RMH97_06900 [Verrucomicrobiales bacterium]|nr:hypothetical protein [Verrucomicrobiales bacterium]
MHALLQPIVVKRAVVAGTLSGLACVPRLHLWADRMWPVWYLVALLFCAAFILWAFVFAWHTELAGRDPLTPSANIVHWLAATAWGGTYAVLAHTVLDPKLRAFAPAEFPTGIGDWLADMLVALAFGRLFLLFGPVAFFGRLFHSVAAAVVLTACFNGFVLVLNASRLGLPAELVLVMLPTRVVASLVNAVFYVKGGVWTVVWISLLVQQRHLWQLCG